jgi:hypothetical protein
MARIVRNISALVFLVTALLTPVSLQAWTCEQQGIFVVAMTCEGSCSQSCFEYECFAYAGGIGGGEDCFWSCVDGATWACQ